MRILIDTSSITKRRTGTGTYSSGLLKSLLMIPDVEHVLAVGGEIDRESLDHQEKLIHLFPGDTRWHYLLNNVWTGNRYNWDANLAFFPNYFMPFAFPIRSIVTIHDVSFLSHPECYSRRMRTWYAYRIKQTVSHADQILTVSESSRLDIMHYLGIPGNRIQVIEPGSSLSHHDKPDAFRKIKNHNRFLYIGTIEPRKNIIKMLRGFSAAKSPDLQLQMAGQIHCSRSYWRRVQALISADRRIRYLGYVSDKRLQKELSDCDALVNLSQIEGFGLPVMEGLLYGKGCLVSEDPALLSLAGKHGVKVCGYHIKEITRGFERMRCSLAAIGEDDPAKLRSYYSWMRFARQLIPVVQRQTEVICLPFAENPDSAQAFGVTGLQRAIIEALTYSAVFRCPLTLNQLYQRLPVVKCTYQEFVKSLKQLCYNYPNIFRVDDRYVYLEPFDIGAGKRDSDLADNDIFINRHAKVIRWLRKLPWIRGIYYSGGTVHGSHLLKKDLDLFIVAHSCRIWLLYTLLKGFALVVRKRSILCFNYLVDESALVIHHQRDLYTAHQLACLQTALPGSDMPEPLHYNQWVYDLFPNLEKAKPVPVEKRDVSSSWWYWMNLTVMGLWTGWWSRKGLKNRQGGILWDFHRIKLHTRDHRPFVYKKYQALLQDVKLRILASNRQMASSAYKYSQTRDPGTVVTFAINGEKEREPK